MFLTVYRPPPRLLVARGAGRASFCQRRRWRRQLAPPRQGDAEIVFAFHTGDRGDGMPFDSQFGVAAHAFPPPSCNYPATSTSTTRKPGRPMDKTTSSCRTLKHSQSTKSVTPYSESPAVALRFHQPLVRLLGSALRMASKCCGRLRRGFRRCGHAELKELDGWLEEQALELDRPATLSGRRSKMDCEHVSASDSGRCVVAGLAGWGVCHPYKAGPRSDHWIVKYEVT